MIEDEREETAEAKASQNSFKKNVDSSNVAVDTSKTMHGISSRTIGINTEELSTAEIEAISDLTASSAVHKEKAKLAKLQANIDAVQSSSKDEMENNLKGFSL